VAAEIACVGGFRRHRAALRGQREALAAYHRHPAHLETRALVDPLIAEHWIADYEA
jgi:hypothetical protein